MSCVKSSINIENYLFLNINRAKIKVFVLSYIKELIVIEALL